MSDTLLLFLPLLAREGKKVLRKKILFSEWFFRQKEKVFPSLREKKSIYGVICFKLCRC